MMATFGVIGLLAGIALLFMEQILMDISGSIVSAGIAIKVLKQ